MPVFQSAQLVEISERILAAAGAPLEVARLVSTSLVESNLVGHDSHGVIRIPSYVRMVKEGKVDPLAQPVVLKETDTMALVDGKWAFGQVSCQHTTRLVIQKAKKAGMAAAGIVRCNHSGRLGEYSLMVAREQLIGVVMVRGVQRPGAMAPHGGSARIFGTNPISFAVPAGELPPVLVDFATAAVAAGKIDVARAKGTSLPPGCILDKAGRPSVNPQDFYDGGILLPVGGHKGYGLALVADLLAGQLMSAEVYEGNRSTQGTFIMAIDIEPFRPRTEFGEAVDQRLKLIKSIPPAAGVSEVLIPGEPEYRSTAERRRSGIEVPQATWKKLLDTASELGVELPDPVAS
jgi:LDH2 family malate/lactate/ureidoglycolate dehydrogenase